MNNFNVISIENIVGFDLYPRHFVFDINTAIYYTILCAYIFAAGTYIFCIRKSVETDKFYLLFSIPIYSILGDLSMDCSIIHVYIYNAYCTYNMNSV